MKKIFLSFIFLLSCSACSFLNAPSNVVKVDSCSDENGYAWSDYTELTDDRGFNTAYTCKFPMGTTCEIAQNAKRIEIVGEGFMYKQCQIIK